jgi:hypothetical protein
MGERLKRIDPRVPSASVTVALATFHSSMLVLVLVVLGLVYLFGDLGKELDGLNTFAGLGLFAYLWVITWFTTAEALRRLGWPELVRHYDILPQSMLWGGVTGVATIVVAVPFGMVAAVLYGVTTADSDVAGFVIFLPIIAAIASPFAFAVGAFVGMWIGLVDYVLLVVTNSVIRVRPSDAKVV